MEFVTNMIDWVVDRVPQPWGGVVGAIVTIAVVIALVRESAKIVRETAKFFGLDIVFDFKKSEHATLPEPSQMEPAPPAMPTKEEVYRRVADGIIDRETAEWLLRSHNPNADEKTREAFVQTVEQIGVAPRPGEKEALELFAQGDAQGAFERLSSVAAEKSDPKLLQTLSALAAPVNPQLGVEALARYTAATESRPLENADRLRLSYGIPGRDDIEVGVITGNLANVQGIDAWVSSENDWLMMARQMDATISGTVRYLAAKKAGPLPSSVSQEGRFGPKGEDLPLALNDPMQKALRRNAYGRLQRRPMGFVKMTGAGELARTHGVKRVFHVVSVRATPLGGVAPGETPGDYVVEVVRRADAYNRFFLRPPFAKLRSIVIPLFGTGMGRLKPEQVSDMLVDGLLRAANAIAARGGKPSLTRLYLLAFASREYLPLRDSFEKRVETKDLAPRRRVDEAVG